MPWQPNNVAKMLSTPTNTTCIHCTDARKRIAISWLGIAIRVQALVQRMQVVSVDVDNIFATLFGCHGDVPRKIGKLGTDASSARRVYLYGEKTAKIGPVCPEIFE